MQPLTWATLKQCRQFHIRPTTAGWNRGWIRHQLEGLKIRESTLLDLGSGAAGPLSYWYSRRVRHAFLIDFYHPPVTFPNCTSLTHDLNNPLPLADHSIDIVISSCTFQFLSPAARRLQMTEIQRVLRPGGLAFLTMSWLFHLTEEALAIFATEPLLLEHHIHLHPAPNVNDLLNHTPDLPLDGDADLSQFPGHPGFSLSRLLTDPNLLLMNLVDPDPSLFRPQAVALNIQRLGLGIRLRKNTGDLQPIPTHTLPPAITVPAPTKPIEEYPPLLVHVHLPKNAGSSFNDLLSSTFGERFIPQYFPDPAHHFDDFTMAQFIEAHPQALALASHSFAVFPPVVAGRRMLYVTFLRHPLARHRSYYRYARKHYEALSEQHKKTLPPDFPSMSAGDFTNFIADLAEEHLISTQTLLLCGRDDSDVAIELLSQFHFVGVVEEMNDSMEQLKRKLSEVHLNLDDRSLARVNVTEERDVLDSPDEIDPASARLLTYLQADVELHAWARENLRSPSS